MKNRSIIILLLLLAIAFPVPARAARQTISNGESGLSVRTKVNSMFEEVYNNIAAISARVIPAGGVAGQALIKQSANDYDADWEEISGTGLGDVTGPVSSTDNAVARFDLTTGKLLQNSSMTLSDGGTPNIPTGQTYNINGSPHNHSGAYEPVMTAASQAEMETGTEATLRSMSPLRVAQAIAARAGSGTGDVVGPASATDNAVPRYDTTTGKLLQNSFMTVNDFGSPNIPTGQTYNIGGSAHGHTEAEIVVTPPTGYTETDQAALNDAFAAQLQNTEPISTASQAEMEAGTETTVRLMTPAGVAQAIAAQAGSGGIDMTISAHGSQSGAVEYSLGTYVAHSLTCTGNTTITFSGVAATGTQQTAYIWITNGGAYTVTVEGLSFDLDADGETLVTATTKDGGTTWQGGFGGSVISAGGWE